MSEARKPTPYVGPRPFELEDEDQFFGRLRETDELSALVIAHRTVLLYAPSGAGKTSLINAGLIPRLKEEGYDVLPVARLQGRIPESILPQDVPNLYRLNTLISWAGDTADASLLLGTSLAQFLEERVPVFDEDGQPAPRVVLLDQFEELFTAYEARWPERAAFLQEIAQLQRQDPLLHVLIAMREDYIAQLDPYVHLLHRQLRTRMRLERLSEPAALDAVREPLKGSGRRFAEGVAETLVKELLRIHVQTVTGETTEIEGPFVEPVQLQVVCQGLWRDLPPEVDVITQKHLERFGDIDQALSQFYEQSIDETRRKTRTRKTKIRAWFEHELITPAETRGTVYRGKEKTGGIPNPAVDVLEALHLIRGERRAGARWYELTHDRFISPIRRSNRSWRSRRRRWMGIGAALVALILTGIVIVGAIQSRRMDEIENQIHQCWIQAGRGAYDEALAACDRAIVLDPEYALPYLYRGQVYREMGDFEQAFQDYATAIDLDPDPVDAYYARGFLYGQLGQYERAIQDYDRAIELGANEARAYNNRGRLYDLLGQDERAIQDFDRAIELDPDHAYAYNNRGWVYSQKGDYARALQDFETSANLDDKNAWVYYYRGLTYVELGETEQAIPDLEAALEKTQPSLEEDQREQAIATLKRLRGG